jgi:hypothetical protein
LTLRGYSSGIDISACRECEDDHDEWLDGARRRSFGGDELACRVDLALHAELPPDIPALDLTPYEEAASGVLLESRIVEPVIVTEAIPLGL